MSSRSVLGLLEERNHGETMQAVKTAWQPCLPDLLHQIGLISSLYQSPLQLIGSFWSVLSREHYLEAAPGVLFEEESVSFAVPASDSLSDTICCEHTQVSVRQSIYSPLSSTNSSWDVMWLNIQNTLLYIPLCHYVLYILAAAVPAVCALQLWQTWDSGLWAARWISECRTKKQESRQNHLTGQSICQNLLGGHASSHLSVQNS